jgi:hypothetical protein
MNTSKEYRLRAEECLQLANEATEIYVKVALAELATEFRKMAECTEPRHARANSRRRHCRVGRQFPRAAGGVRR